MSKFEMDPSRYLYVTQEGKGNRQRGPVAMRRTVTSIDKQIGKRERRNTHQRSLTPHIHPVREERPESENRVTYRRSRSKIKYGWYFLFSFVAFYGASKSGLLDKVAKAVQAANDGNVSPPAEVQKKPTQVKEKKPAAKCIISPKYPESIRRYSDVIRKYSQANGLNPNLIAAVILQESGGDPNAYSHSGAVGLMQVMPRDGIAATFINPANGKQYFASRPTIEELEDPEFNIKYGTGMLGGLVSKYKSVREALKHYGPLASSMPNKYYYADKVLKIYENYGHGCSETGMVVPDIVSVQPAAHIEKTKREFRQPGNIFDYQANRRTSTMVLRQAQQYKLGAIRA